MSDFGEALEQIRRLEERLETYREERESARDERDAMRGKMDTLAAELATAREALEKFASKRNWGLTLQGAMAYAFKGAQPWRIAEAILSSPSAAVDEFKARIRREALEEARAVAIKAVCPDPFCNDPLCPGIAVASALLGLSAENDRALAAQPKPEGEKP